jgi:hypothetical protein
MHVEDGNGVAHGAVSGEVVLVTVRGGHAVPLSLAQLWCSLPLPLPLPIEYLPTYLPTTYRLASVFHILREGYV